MRVVSRSPPPLEESVHQTAPEDDLDTSSIRAASEPVFNISSPTNREELDSPPITDMIDDSAEEAHFSSPSSPSPWYREESDEIIGDQYKDETSAASANNNPNNGSDQEVMTTTPAEAESPWSSVSEESDWNNSASVLNPLRREIIEQLATSFRPYMSHPSNTAPQCTQWRERTTGNSRPNVLSASNRNQGRQTRKRPRSNSNDEKRDGSGSDDGFAKTPQSPEKYPRVDEGLLWACPFYKWNRIRYRGCYNATLREFSRIK